MAFINFGSRGGSCDNEVIAINTDVATDNINSVRQAKAGIKPNLAYIYICQGFTQFSFIRNHQCVHPCINNRLDGIQPRDQRSFLCAIRQSIHQDESRIHICLGLAGFSLYHSLFCSLQLHCIIECISH